MRDQKGRADPPWYPQVLKPTGATLAEPDGNAGTSGKAQVHHGVDQVLTALQNSESEGICPVTHLPGSLCSLDTGNNHKTRGQRSCHGEQYAGS